MHATIAQVSEAHPGVGEWLDRSATRFRAEMARTAPREIPEELFHAARFDAPSFDYMERGPFRSFQAQQRTAGNVTATYLKRGARCWIFHTDAGIGIAEIIERVRLHLQETAK